MKPHGPRRPSKFRSFLITRSTRGEMAWLGRGRTSALMPAPNAIDTAIATT
jgi:hypothetical protein